MPRIVIADDHDYVRRGVRHILETQEEWEIVGEASNGQEAIQLNRQLHPGVIIMDITMPVMNGIKRNSQGRSAQQSANSYRVRRSECLGVCSTLGCQGMVAKSQAMDELTPALKAIIAGGTYFH
jgi:DNA-binding NarL/FixJ family response regulator